MTRKNRTALVAAASLLAACAAVALYPPAVVQGQQAPAAAANDLELGGRSGTVEYRPVASTSPNGFIQKQRTGVIRKVTPEWVVLEEGGALVAVPREMVLEIRFDKK